MPHMSCRKITKMKKKALHISWCETEEWVDGLMSEGQNKTVLKHITDQNVASTHMNWFSLQSYKYLFIQHTFKRPATLKAGTNGDLRFPFCQLQRKLLTPACKTIWHDLPISNLQSPMSPPLHPQCALTKNGCTYTKKTKKIYPNWHYSTVPD